MQSFLSWLLKDLFWENIVWIGLAGAAILLVLTIIGHFLPDPDEGATNEIGGGDGSDFAGGQEWEAGDVTGLLPSTATLTGGPEDSEDGTDWFDIDEWKD